MIKDLLEENISQAEVLNYYNANVSYKCLPRFIRGFVFNYNGIYNIIVNDNLSYYLKKKTILHELAHIELNQLCQYDKDLLEFHRQDYEDEADEYIKMIKDNIRDFNERMM